MPFKHRFFFVNKNRFDCDSVLKLSLLSISKSLTNYNCSLCSRPFLTRLTDKLSKMEELIRRLYITL